MKRALALLGAAICVLLAWAPAASAHPLGNFTVNRYAEVVVRPGRVTIGYVLDLAEIPAYQTLGGIAPDREATAEDLQRWADRTAAAIARGLLLRVDGRGVEIHVDDATAAVAPGQGGLSTLRLDARLVAPLEVSSGRLSFVDRNDPGRLGWRELVGRGAGGIALAGSTAPTETVTDGLRSYPEDLLSAPLDVRSMRTRFRPGVSVAPSGSAADGDSAAPGDAGVLDRVLGRSGGLVMLVGFALACAVGAWHALLPGHGKTLMAAAAVGSDPRPRDAVVAGLAVAGMHTCSVIGLGLLIVALEHTFRPEAVYPWLRLASGLAAVAVGVHLVRRRWRARHEDALAHGADHDHADGHTHGLPERPLSRPGLTALALAGGILPSPSALLVLLASLQRGRAVYGLAVVLSFSVGLAASLIVVALAAMRARRSFERRSSRLLGRVLPVAAAFAVVAVGLVVAGGAIASR